MNNTMLTCTVFFFIQLYIELQVISIYKVKWGITKLPTSWSIIFNFTLIVNITIFFTALLIAIWN